MKYLIISDSHSNNEDLMKLINKYKGYKVIHLGDRKMDVDGINIKGNCDLTGDNYKIIDVNSKKWFITHGNLYDVKYDELKIYYMAKSVNADVCLFGHTHKRCDYEYDNIRFINPGALLNGYYIIYDKEFKFLEL